MGRLSALTPPRNRPSTRAEGLLAAAGFDELAAQTPEIDSFCSSSRWILPALDAFHPRNRPYVLTGEGVAALAVGSLESVGTYLVAMESTWGLASPFAFERVEEFSRWFGAALWSARDDFDVALFTGIPVRSRLMRGLVRALQGRFRLQLSSTTTRHRASLDGGMDGFLSRRSRKFRRNLRNAERRTRQAGVTFRRHYVRHAEELDSLYDRIIAVEKKSWKALGGNGVDANPMKGFVRDVLRRSSESEECRVIIAQLGDRDIGYIHGAIAENTFRGLQMSFDHEFAELSLGNVLQARMIEWVCESELSLYDLGSELAYKKRWSESAKTSVGIIVVPL